MDFVVEKLLIIILVNIKQSNINTVFHYMLFLFSLSIYQTDMWPFFLVSTTNSKSINFFILTMQ